MTIGRVISSRKPIVPMTIVDGIGHRHSLRAILDTGFTGELVLPARYINRFGLVMDRESDGRPAGYRGTYQHTYRRGHRHLAGATAQCGRLTIRQRTPRRHGIPLELPHHH